MSTKEHVSTDGERLPAFLTYARFRRETGIGRKLFESEVAAGRIIARKTKSGRIFIPRDEIQAWFNRLDEVAA